MSSSRSGYPRAAEHIALHDDFAESAESFARAHVEGRGKSVVELASFMQEWLETHIRNEDRPFIDHVRAWHGSDAGAS